MDEKFSLLYTLEKKRKEKGRNNSLNKTKDDKLIIVVPEELLSFELCQ